ncbi:DUF2255 family protein [Agromyces sp. MMS24-JH15]|uniref:DUF2255 family protein n=1 Tax=Agromyces sp. MMS24-JH15 TaxID=3243765 RepID=UPI0037491942
MTEWTVSELEAIAGLREIRLAGRRVDGSARTLTTVWHVVVDGAPYVRSMYGTDGQWYRGVSRHFEGVIDWGAGARDVRFVPDDTHDDDIDAALVAKYGDTSASRHIMTPASKETTLRIDPK